MTALFRNRNGRGTGGRLWLVGPSARSYRRKRDAATAARRRDGSLEPRARLGDRCARHAKKGTEHFGQRRHRQRRERASRRPMGRPLLVVRGISEEPPSELQSLLL